MGKLEAVAVRVVHVEQPHLAVQLEDDADLDAFAAEFLGDVKAFLEEPALAL